MNIFLKYLFLLVFGLVVLTRLNVHSDTFNMQKIADGIYVHTGFHHEGLHDIANIGFIVGEESIAVIIKSALKTEGTVKVKSSTSTKFNVYVMYEYFLISLNFYMRMIYF